MLAAPNAAFWRNARAPFLKALRPLFEEAFWDGARAGALEIPRAAERADVDPDADPLTPWLDELSPRVDEFLDTYLGDWWAGLVATRRETIRTAIREAKRAGLDWREVARRINRDYSPARASAIAITEVTNVMGAGAQATYAAAGFDQWQWRTVRDVRVDPICEVRSDTTYPMTTPFSAAHVACRCWPVPYGGPNPIAFGLTP